MKYYPLDKLNNMICNIVAEGKKEIWQSIEEIKNPLERCKERKLFAVSIKKLNNK